MVVIEQNPKANLADEARRLRVPVIQDDGQRQETLAGAAVALAVLIAMNRMKVAALTPAESIQIFISQTVIREYPACHTNTCLY